MVKEIPLQNGMVALVDDEDYARCMELVWHANKTSDSALIVTNRRKKSTLGRFILMVDEDEKRIVASINNNPLDFRKENLNLVTPGKQAITSKGHKNTSSKYKGVSWNKSSGKWVASLMVNGKALHLGYYTSEDIAAETYNKAVLKYRGNGSYLNKIGVDNNTTEIELKKAVIYRRVEGVTSEYRGIHKLKYDGSFSASIYFNGRKEHIGIYSTEIEAALAYDNRAIEIHGDKAILNFPETYQSTVKNHAE